MMSLQQDICNRVQHLENDLIQKILVQHTGGQDILYFDITRVQFIYKLGNDNRFDIMLDGKIIGEIVRQIKYNDDTFDQNNFSFVVSFIPVQY